MNSRELKARLPEALCPIPTNPLDPEYARHVFDSEDGMRVLVSREDDGSVVFSVSVRPGSPAHTHWRELRDTSECDEQAADRLTDNACMRFRSLSGYEGKVSFVACTQNGALLFSIERLSWEGRDDSAALHHHQAWHAKE